MRKLYYFLILLLLPFSAMAGNATQCLSIQTNAYGGAELFNSCNIVIEAKWCYMDENACRTYDNQWTIQPGRGYPIKNNKEVRYAACAGANSFKRVEGLTFWCEN